MMVSGFVLLIVCANVAHLMLVRGMERRRQTAIERGARGASFAGREARADGKPPPLRVRWRGWPGRRLCRNATDSALRIPLGARIRRCADRGVPFHAGAAVCLRHVAVDRRGLRYRSRVDDDARRPDRSAPRDESLDHSCGLAAEKNARRLSSGALACPALSVGAAHRRLAEPRESGFRIRTGSALRGDHRSAAWRISSRPTLAALPTDPRCHRAHAGRIVGGALPVLAAGPRGWGTGVWVDGHLPPGPKDQNVAAWDRVTAGYFDVIGTPIMRGRGISDQDTASSRHVAVIDETFARTFFRNEDPIGKHFGRKPGASREFEVVGVAQRCTLSDIRSGSASLAPSSSCPKRKRNTRRPTWAHCSCATLSFGPGQGRTCHLRRCARPWPP